MIKIIFSLTFCTVALFAFHITQASAKVHTFKLTLTGYASMKPSLMQEIVAKNSGIIQDEHLLNGANIKQNEPLFAISGITTNSKMITLQSDIVIAKNRYNLLKKEYKRVLHLYTIHAAYAKELQSIKAKYQRSKTTLYTLQKQLGQYNHKIFYTAKTNATVLSIAKQNGSFVRAGETVLTLSSCNKLYATAQIFDPHNKIKPSDAVIIKTPFGDKTAKVDAISMIAANSGAKEINFIFTQAKCQIMPNVIYRVTVLLKEFNAVAVPSECIMKKGDRFYLLVMDNNQPKALHVKIGITQNGYTQIKSGIKQGQKVVVSGAYFLFNKNINKTLKIQD